MTSVPVITPFVHTLLFVYAALFPVVNPIGDAPVFLNLTQFYTPSQRHLLAQKVAFNSFLLLLASLFVGSHVLSFFGVELAILQVGGGIVVAALGWRLLNAPPAADGHRETSATLSAIPDAFYPLTMPLTIDPGVMSVAITVGSHHDRNINVEKFALLASAAVAGVLAISLTIYFCYRFGARLVSLLGRDGTSAVIRISAFFLFCIGIQILWTGWSQIARP